MAKLITYYIDPDPCTACMICNRVLACPAIYDQGNGVPPVIDEAECIGCDMCRQVCPYDAIFVRNTNPEREAELDRMEVTRPPELGVLP